MKLLSNFDTNHADKLKNELIHFFGDEYVLLIRKSRLIWYAKILPQISLFFLITGIGLYVIQTSQLPINPIVVRVFWWLVWLWWLILIGKSIQKYIDFRMDFLIVTPKEIMKYDQKWVLSRSIEKITADKIKTISLYKEWFIQSLFDIWTLIFLAEWELESGNIEMQYIHHVGAVEKKIRHILGQDRI